MIDGLIGFVVGFVCGIGALSGYALSLNEVATRREEKERLSKLEEECESDELD